MAYGKSGGNTPGAKKRKWNPNWKKSTVVAGASYKPLSTPSEEQTAIFAAHAANTAENLMISAYAGCGKTTTCVEVMHRTERARPSASQAYIIYAKRNEEEAKGKCPASSTVATAHAFGLRALNAHFGAKVDVDNEKTYRIAQALIGPEDEKAQARFMLSKAIDLGKDHLCTTREQVDAMMDRHGIESGEIGDAEFAAKVLEGMRVSKEQPKVVSFSDMVWLPLVLGARIPTFDEVLLDEGQDLNAARQELAFRAVGKGRLTTVGDPNQAIFGFTGADFRSLDTIRARSNARVLPLHKTYRCGRAIVREAQAFVPDYEAASSNSEGEVARKETSDMMATSGAMPGDFILSRTNAPTIKIALALLKQGRRANIQGRDLGSNLLYMVKRSKAQSVLQFQEWLNAWKNAECERLQAKGRSFEHIVDKAECLETFCEGERDINTVRAKIDALFSDKDDAAVVMLSTVHRSKGLERKRVWLLESSFVCRPKTDEDKQQEQNVRYVAITRAIDSLFYVA